MVEAVVVAGAGGEAGPEGEADPGREAAAAACLAALPAVSLACFRCILARSF